MKDNEKEMSQNISNAESSNKVNMKSFKLLTLFAIIGIILLAFVSSVSIYTATPILLLPVFVLQIVHMFLKVKKDKITNYQIFAIIAFVISIVNLIVTVIVANSFFYNNMFYNNMFYSYNSDLQISVFLAFITGVIILIAFIIYLIKLSTASQNKRVENAESKSVNFTTQNSMKSKIEELKQLKDSNIITKEEYDNMFDKIVINENKQPEKPTVIDVKTEKINNLKQMKSDGVLNEEEYKKLLNELLTK